ncbi:MAG: hypothetical protein WCP62_03710 [Planctomycetota bacterium]
MCQIESPNPIATAESLGFQNDRTNTSAKEHQASDSGIKLHEARFSKGGAGRVFAAKGPSADEPEKFDEDDMG